ncbi:hypothetical protein NSPZN2_10597 [Nitrospira defluvii]|uniref:Uncharacterized protein n=1 Tax=Nitrospira defluvii TaxID=330214 RepID=A0ABM8QI59_9BACT|nr:hypothetical protein NSPZN2_10597 [Nitrospira defluvii]
MNCPPATSRVVMATLHQVQSRSGKAGVEGDALDGDVDGSVMARILAKGLRVCQRALRTRNFGDKYLQCFKRSV